MRQRPKLDTFQRGLFRTLTASTNSVLKAAPIAVGQYSGKLFTFSF